MNCACEGGSRENYYAVITDVIDAEKAQAMLDALLSPLPSPDGLIQTIKEGLEAEPPPGFEALVQDTKESIEKGPTGKFTVMMERGGFVGQIPVNCDVFPQALEWAKARIGKMIHVTVKPQGDGTTMDVHDPKE